MRFMFSILSIVALAVLFFLTGPALSSECVACQETYKESYGKEVFVNTGDTSKDQWTKTYCFATKNGKFCLWKHFKISCSIGDFVKKCSRWYCCPHTHQCEQNPCQSQVIRHGVSICNSPMFAGSKVIKEGSTP